MASSFRPSSSQLLIHINNDTATMAKASAASPSTSSRGKKAPRASAEASKASSSSEKLLDGHVAPSQALKAFKALESHRNKHKASVAEASKDSGKSQLPLDAEADDDVGGSRSEDTVYLNVAIKRLSPTKKSKPHQIPLPNPLHDPKTSSVCLIVKDPQRHYKDLLPTLGVKCVHRVVGVSKLKVRTRGKRKADCLFYHTDSTLLAARSLAGQVCALRGSPPAPRGL